MKKSLLFFLLVFSYTSAQAWQGWYRYVTPEQSTITTYSFQSNLIHIQDENKMQYKIEMLDNIFFRSVDISDQAGNPALEISYNPELKQYRLEGNVSKVYDVKANSFYYTPFLAFQLRNLCNSFNTSQGLFTIYDHRKKPQDMFIRAKGKEVIHIMGEEVEVLVYETGPAKKINAKKLPFKTHYYFRSSDGRLMKTSVWLKDKNIEETFLIKEKQ